MRLEQAPWADFSSDAEANILERLRRPATTNVGASAMWPPSYLQEARISALVLLLLVTAACGDPVIDSRRPSHVEAKLSNDIETVVKLAWRTQEPTRGYVEYGTTAELGLQTPLEAEETSEHEALLLGLPQETRVYYRVVTWDGDSAGVSDVGSIEPGRIPR